MKYLFVNLLMFFSLAVFAQTEKPLIQFSGTITNVDSVNSVVPYVTITNLSNNNQVNLANYKGYFSFVVHERDTLRFSSVGFIPLTIIIPAGITSKSYSQKIEMKAQITNLPTFHVFPWATTDEFRRDFLTMKVADDDLEIARKNLNKASLAEMAKTLPRDANEIQSFNQQQMHYNIVNSHSITNPLLNPIAWGTLIKSIADGDKSRGGN